MDIQKLDRLFEKLDNKFNINEGGCCFVAYCIAKNLEKLNIKYSLVLYCYKDNINKKRTIRNLKGKVKNGFPSGSRNCNHYAIMIDNFIVNDIEDFDGNKFEITNVTSEDLKFIYSRGHWNYKYDICNNNKVQKSINYFFKNEKEKER